MEILYLTYARIPTERANGLQVAKTCEALAKNGDKVTLVIPGRNRFADKVTPDIFEHYRLARVFGVRRVWVPRLMMLSNFGIFLQNIYFSVAASLSVVCRVGAVVYSRQPALLLLPALFGRHTVFESHEGRFTPTIRLILALGTRMITITRASKDIYIKKGVRADNIGVAPDSVDLAVFTNLPTTEESRSDFGLPQDAKIVMYTGSFGLYDWKGLDVFLEASNLVRNNVIFVAAGGKKKEIDALKNSGKYPKVIFFESIANTRVPSLLSAANILVIPNKRGNEISEYHTSPMKLFEYMTVGKPIIASGVTSILEVVDNTSAKIFEPNSPESLARCVDELIDDSHNANELGKKSGELARLYTWDMRAKTIDKWLKTFYERH